MTDRPEREVEGLGLHRCDCDAVRNPGTECDWCKVSRAYYRLSSDNDVLRSERDRLEAEVERLREAERAAFSAGAAWSLHDAPTETGVAKDYGDWPMTVKRAWEGYKGDHPFFNEHRALEPETEEPWNPYEKRRHELPSGGPPSTDTPTEPHRQPQDADTGLNAIMGKWPGDESDEEIRAAMEPRTCRWTEAGWYYRTECGGGVYLEGFGCHIVARGAYCPYCGGKLVTEDATEGDTQEKILDRYASVQPSPFEGLDLDELRRRGTQDREAR